MLKVIVDSIVDRLSNGLFDKKDSLHSYSVLTASSMLLTKDWYTKVFKITNVPINLSDNLAERLKLEIKKIEPDMKLVIDISISFVPMTKDNTFMNKFEASEEIYLKMKKMFESQTSSGKSKGVALTGGYNSFKFTKTNLDNLKSQFETYEYVSNKIDENSPLALVDYNIILSHKERDTIMRAYDICKQALGKTKVYFEKIDGSYAKWMKTNSIFGQKKVVGNIKTPLLWSSENIAKQCLYREIGDISNTGVIKGIDYFTKLPVSIDFWGNANGQVSCTLAKTGAGKTFYISSSILIESELGIHNTVYDFKGDEYSGLSKLIKGSVTIDYSSGHYFNTLDLKNFDEEFFKDNIDITPGDMFDNAVQGTVLVACTACGYNEKDEDSSTIFNIINQATVQMFKNKNISRNKVSSFKLTESLTYQDLIASINDISLSPTFKSLTKKKRDKMMSDLNNYLSPLVSNSGYMKYPISLKKIINAPLVVYSFNKNKSVLELGVVEKMQVMMSTTLDTFKLLIRKKQSKGTTITIEELQRIKNELPLLLPIIVARVTGARSLNCNTNLLTNSIEVLASKEFAAISENISTYAIGNINRNTLDLITNPESGFVNERVKLFVEKIIESYESQENSLKNHFCLNYSTGSTSGTTLLKAYLPPDMAKQLETRHVGAM